MVMKGYSTFPKAPELESHQNGHLLGSGFTPLQRCRRRILQPQPIRRRKATSKIKLGNKNWKKKLYGYFKRQSKDIVHEMARMGKP